MEMKISFDGRQLAMLALAAVCAYGIYSGISLASEGKDLQKEVKAMQAKIEKIRAGQADELSMSEKLEVAALGMQMRIDPNVLENFESEADKNLMRGYAIFVGSLVGAGFLLSYYRNTASKRLKNADA